MEQSEMEWRMSEEATHTAQAERMARNLHGLCRNGWEFVEGLGA
mgnify:CR=1 FL=1